VTPFRHHFTVDVEEFFHSTALARRMAESEWDALPRRAPVVIDWLLDLLDESGSRSTFFILGWLAEREPDLVKRIAERGHEIAGHSWDHRRVTAQTPAAFRTSMRRTKLFLEDLTGRPVVGFRAPSFSIRPGSEWALDILIEEGYAYDSSLFPIGIHPGYGYPDGNADPYVIERPPGVIVEVPPLTLAVLGRRLPAAGGAYLRFFPSRLLRSALRQAEGRGEPGTLYIHPWDLDPDIERLSLPPLLTLRLHAGAHRARGRVVRLLRDYAFGPIAETVTTRWPRTT
jgi:polysaccharide deacetylase family protein (PEP-CTERM system associated)